MAREYKDSGIEWIGQIPKEWEQYRIKYNTFLKGRIGWQGLNSSDFLDEGYCLITGTDFDNKGGINWNSCYRISEERYNEDELLHVKKGDLLMTKDGTVGKMAFIKELPEEASLNSHLLIIRQLTKLIDNSFLYWVMLSDVFKGFSSFYQSGTIMSSISQGTLGFFACYCPPLSEQQKIADYLDKVCGEVDEMVALQETMIEELKAYKQSVIRETITKGLGSNVLMKKSGSLWIGDFPNTWKLTRMGDVGEYKKGPFGSAITLDMFVPKGEKTIKVYEQQNAIKKDWTLGYYYISEDYFNSNLKSFEVLPNDLIVSCAGTIGEVYQLPQGIERGIINQALMRMRINDTIHLSYFLYVFDLILKGEAERSSNGTAIKNIPPFSVFKKILIPLPPFSEQQEISSYLDEKCSEIDALIALKQAKIEELKEYKKSVIYEYVTGKKEIN